MTTPQSQTLLHDTAAALLEYAAGLLDAAGYPRPERTFVTAGRVTPFPGCDALGIYASRVYTGMPGAEVRQAPGCAQPTTGVFLLELHRCIPTISEGGPVPTAQVAASAEGLNEQGFLLLRGMQMILSGKPGQGRLYGLAGPLDAIRPDGGLGGWQLTLTAQIVQQP